MKRTFVFVLMFTLIFSSLTFAQPNNELTKNYSKNLAPPNEGKIAEYLIKQGIIDKNTSPQEIDEAVTKYLRKRLTADFEKFSKTDKTSLTNSIELYGDKGLNYDNLLHGKKFGKELGEVDSVYENEWDGEIKEGKLLVLLAEFGDDENTKGPLHNQIEKPSDINNADFWVDDFSKDHYQKMLFTEGGYDAVDKDGNTMHLDSMVDFYLEQSGGSYKVDGDVYGWYELDHSEAYYGANDENDNDINPRGLVKDLLTLAADDIDFDEYDLEDPYDLDGDSNFYEPDGIIDRLVIVHAGVDESGGGGAQGTDALWAHSWDLGGLYNIPGTEMYAYNYIMQGENGAIGVFCHEFGHDLGLPDEYDTIYSGNGDSVGFYSIMSSGSWVGKPLGTMPSPFSPWGKMKLQSIHGGNWMSSERVTEVDFDDVTKDGLKFKLDQATSKGNNNQVIKVNLSKQRVETIAPHEGGYEWYSGKENNLNASMNTKEISLPQANNIELNYWTWYYTEEGYDYGYIDISTDNGQNWNQLKVIEGSSNGWINEIVDLSEYSGENIVLQFRYVTDGGWLEEGIYLDEIKVVADGNVAFEDYADSEENWSTVEWKQYEGFDYKDHYYLIELRNHNNTDENLKYGYNWVDYENGVVEYFQHEPGMLVWYVNEAYTDNWVGVHPGYGYLGIVDSHPQPLVASGTEIRTRIQTHDASFNYDRVPDKTFTFFDKTKVVQGKQAVPEFNDSHSYWNNKAPSAGLKLPTYGLKFKIVGQSSDGTVVEVVIYK